MIKNLFTKLKSYLEVSNFERRGALALLFLLISVVFFNYWNNNVSYQRVKVDEKKLAAFRSQLDSSLVKEKRSRFKRASSKHKNFKDYNQSKSTAALRQFNPNQDSFDELVSKGLEPKVAKNIVNYRTKGGYFKTAEDLEKLYAIGNKYFDKIEPYVLIETIRDNRFKTKSDSITFSVVIININSASKDDLIKLRGIGEYYANKILNFRNALGGFYSIEQIKDTRGLPSETFEIVKNQMAVDPALIQKISLNKANKDQLAKHPYVSYKQAAAIINFRKQHGNFKSIDKLNELYVFNKVEVSRLLHYLDLL